MKDACIRACSQRSQPFADLGLPNSEQELFKAKLTLQIYKLIKERELTQSKAAELLGTTQAQVSALMRPEVTKRPPDTHKEILASFQCDGASARRPPRNQIGGMCCTENHVGLVKMYGNPSLWAFPTAITKLVRIRRAFRYFWPRE